MAAAVVGGRRGGGVGEGEDPTPAATAAALRHAHTHTRAHARAAPRRSRPLSTAGDGRVWARRSSAIHFQG